MTVQSVVREVCAVVGVRPPSGSVFLSPYVDRTAWEFVQLTNEMAQRIAYDTRDWTTLRQLCTIGFNGEINHPLPADYHRMLLTSQVWRSTNTTAPMTFVPDADDWLRGELQGRTIPVGEWTIFNNEIHIRPMLAASSAGPPVVPAEMAKFYYLRNTCVILTSGGFGTQFLNDADTFVLPERLLKLGMIWQWKANKGASYAEDLANYEDALSRIAGNDKPAPIIVGRYPISSDATIAYWGPTPAGATFVGPGP